MPQNCYRISGLKAVVLTLKFNSLLIDLRTAAASRSGLALRNYHAARRLIALDAEPVQPPLLTQAAVAGA